MFCDFSTRSVCVSIEQLIRDQCHDQTNHLLDHGSTSATRQEAAIRERSIERKRAPRRTTSTRPHRYRIRRATGHSPNIIELEICMMFKRKSELEDEKSWLSRNSITHEKYLRESLTYVGTSEIFLWYKLWQTRSETEGQQTSQLPRNSITAELLRSRRSRNGTRIKVTHVAIYSIEILDEVEG